MQTIDFKNKTFKYLKKLGSGWSSGTERPFRCLELDRNYRQLKNFPTSNISGFCQTPGEYPPFVKVLAKYGVNNQHNFKHHHCCQDYYHFPLVR